MNMREVMINTIYRYARETSAGEEVDEYWECVLPEAFACITNEIFLTLHRVHINELMKQRAALFAQTAPPRDISNLENATLMLHYFTRMWLVGKHENRVFQTLVDQSYGVISNTRDAARWVKPSLIWVPHFGVITAQIHDSLVEHYKHYFFGQRCRAEIVRRGRQDEYIKRTFILLSDLEDMRREQDEAIHWLRNNSRRIATIMGAAPDVGEDVLQDRFQKLLSLPLHLQIQKCGATGRAIRDGVIDIHRKGGQYEHVPFDDELADAMPDKSAQDLSERMFADEIPQRLLECQTQIEEILSPGRPEKRKQGQRRFKVMQLLAHTPTLTSSAIANQLRTSEPTICRDRKVIEQSRDRIKEILHG